MTTENKLAQLSQRLDELEKKVATPIVIEEPKSSKIFSVMVASVTVAMAGYSVYDSFIRSEPAGE